MNDFITSYRELDRHQGRAAPTHDDIRDALRAAQRHLVHQQAVLASASRALTVAKHRVSEAEIEVAALRQRLGANA